MEESQDLQKLHKFLRFMIFTSVFVEFFAYAITDALAGQVAAIVQEVHERLCWFFLYQPGHMAYSKLVTLVLILLTSLGTKARKEVEFDSKKEVIWPLTIGTLFVIASVIIYLFSFGPYIYHIGCNIWIYMVLSIVGTFLMHMALDAISKFIKGSFAKDRFNFENESFEQNEDLKETEYSVNIPMRYYHNGKFRKGWINIVNPFRGTFVVGTPGSGKTFSVIEPFIRQHSAKGFAMVVYDYKFPTLAQKLYYHYRKNKRLGKTPKGCSFNMINFVDVEYSRRVNPVQKKYIPNLAAAQETAKTLVDSLNKGKNEGGGGSDQFFQTSAVNFLAACIHFFVNYKKLPFDAEGNELYAETKTTAEGHVYQTGRVFKDATMTVKEDPAYWLGKYSDMPHVLAFLNRSYDEIFEVLKTSSEVYSLLAPFMSAKEGDAMEQLEGMIGTLRVQTSKLDTTQARWIFHRDGDDFDLKVSDPEHPAYLLIANSPEQEEIIGTLNALVLNRLVTRVNSGQGKNVPVSIIVDELPTLFFYKIDRLIGTARSNKVAVTLGFQELPQVEGDYGKTGQKKITSTIGNVITGSAREKETLEWLSNDIFGKVVQVKKGITVDRERVTYNLNENMDNLIPASKIADMRSGWIAGQIASDFVKTEIGRGNTIDIKKAEEFKTSKFFCKTNFDMAAIKAEEENYKHFPLPKPYQFKSADERDRVLEDNFQKVDQDIQDMITEIQMEFAK